MTLNMKTQQEDLMFRTYFIIGLLHLLMDGKEIRVCTNIMDLSTKALAQIYKIRWQVEIFFKWIKQNLNMKRVFGTTRNSVYGQLHLELIAYLILRIIYDYSSPKAVIFKYSFILQVLLLQYLH